MTLAVDVELPGLAVKFDVPPGVTVLCGRSGAGKSRTLGCIAGLVRPTRGRLSLAGALWLDTAENIELPIPRRRVGYVFQTLALFPHLTALENVAYGVARALAKDERRARARTLLRKMHVETLADRKPATLSGGEAQRVALARAFAMDPQVLLLDEPFNALDAALKKELLREVAAEIATRNIPTIVVSHQREDADLLGERLVLIENGRLSATSRNR